MLARRFPILPPVEAPTSALDVLAEAPTGGRSLGKRLSLAPKKSETWEFLLSEFAPEVLTSSKSMPQLCGLPAMSQTFSASRLDLMDLSEPAARTCGFSGQRVSPMAEGRHAVPFGATAWSSEPEALGELFATKSLAPKGKPMTSAKVSKKSKKMKDASPEASAEELEVVTTKATPCKSSSVDRHTRRSKRRPASTSNVGRRGHEKIRAPPSKPVAFGATLNEASWRSNSRRSLSPLAVAPRALERDESADSICSVNMNNWCEPDTIVEEKLEMDGSRPSSALPNKQIYAQDIPKTDPNLWNIGFNDNANDPCVWDNSMEIYSAWGGNDDDWGANVHDEADWDEPDYESTPVF